MHTYKQTIEKQSIFKNVGFWSCMMWGLGALFYCYEYYLRVAPSVMTAELSKAYHVDAAVLGNLAATYYYAYTLMQIPVGVLMDRYGPRIILTIACLACTVGSFMFAGTENLWVGASGRFLIGFGSAFAYVGVLKLTSIWLPQNTFAMFAGLSTALGMFGAISGDITMTTLVAELGWHQTIFYSGIAGTILTLVLWILIRDKREYQAHEAPTKTHSNVHEVFSALWVMCKNPQMWINGFYGFMVWVVISAFAELWGIPYLRDVRSYSPHTSAMLNSLIFLGFAIGGPIFGWFSDKIGRRKVPMMIGATLACACMSALIFIPNLSNIHSGILLFLVGMTASSQCIVFAVARDNNLPQFAGTAAAFTNMVVMLGGMILQPLIGVILDHLSTGFDPVSGLHTYSASNYHDALTIIPVCLFIGVLLSLTLKETYCKVKDDTI